VFIFAWLDNKGNPELIINRILENTTVSGMSLIMEMRLSLHDIVCLAS